MPTCRCLIRTTMSYAIGHDAGGVYGDSYDLKVGEGTASAFAINSGRMAVRKILADK